MKLVASEDLNCTYSINSPQKEHQLFVLFFLEFFLGVWYKYNGKLEVRGTR